MSDDNEQETWDGPGRPLPMSPEDEARLDNAVLLERQTHVEESEEGLTHRLFRENSARVAMSIVNIALRGSNEKLRLDAGKYVVDRVLGKIGDETHRADTPLDAMVKQMQADAEAAANSGLR